MNPHLYLYLSWRAWLASLPLLTALITLCYAFDVADRLPTWAAFPLGVLLGIVSNQWGRLVTRKPTPDA